MGTMGCQPGPGSGVTATPPGLLLLVSLSSPMSLPAGGMTAGARVSCRGQAGETWPSAIYAYDLCGRSIALSPHSEDRTFLDMLGDGGFSMRFKGTEDWRSVQAAFIAPYMAQSGIASNLVGAVVKQAEPV